MHFLQRQAARTLLAVSLGATCATLPMGVSAQAAGAPNAVVLPGSGAPGAAGIGAAAQGLQGAGAGTGAAATGLAPYGMPGMGTLGTPNPLTPVGAGAQAQNIRADLGLAPPLATTQFQRFVQEATGRSLPLFGYNLFDRSRYPSLNEAPVPATYVVGPGDELDLKVWGGVDFAIRLPVDRQGQITVPRVGPVGVAGVAASELDAHLKKQLGRVYANFELSATVGKLRSIQVFVVGQARNPGAYTVSSLSTLVSAVFESGGPAATGSMRKIDLVRAGRTVATLDLYQFINAGQATGDARLLPGDVIVIRPAGPRVALTGAIDNAGIYELAASEEAIAQVLGYSGSSTTLASTHRVLIERVNNQRTKGPREVQDTTLTAENLKAPLRDGDVLTLLPISAAYNNAVTLRGNVAEPLRYPFKAGMRVSDLIPEPRALIVRDYFVQTNALVQLEPEPDPDLANRSDRDPSPGANDTDRRQGRSTRTLRPAREQAVQPGRNVSPNESVSDSRKRLPEVNWEYASIERVDEGQIRSTLIPFNLGAAVRLKDPAHDLVLQPGDVVTVFSVNDIPVPREKRSQFVTVSGEVKLPGVYPVGPKETLLDVIKRAGGFSDAAYVYGTTFKRESTRVQQQANLDQAIRRAEAQVNSQSAMQLQSATDAEKAALAQVQMAAQKTAMERLKSLKASGRIALEIDPARPALPPIVLEDGDEVNVPAQSSFVAVFGAVLAESAFIHRAGSTARDYIERAGPTREADLDGAILIRADGSAVSNSAHRSWLNVGAGSFLSTRMFPGDTVFIPVRLDQRSPYAMFIQGAKDWTQLFYQFGLGAAAVKTFRN